MYSLPLGLPSIEDMKQIVGDFKEKGTRDWDREEEMRKAEAQLRPRKIADDKYQVKIDEYWIYVSTHDMIALIKLIYKMNFLQWQLDHAEYESAHRAVKLKDLCMNYYKRIPPNERPPLPEYFNLM